MTGIISKTAFIAATLALAFSLTLGSIALSQASPLNAETVSQGWSCGNGGRGGYGGHGGHGGHHGGW